MAEVHFFGAAGLFGGGCEFALGLEDVDGGGGVERELELIIADILDDDVGVCGYIRDARAGQQDHKAK